MPRRKKLYLGPGKTLVNGGRLRATDGKPVISPLDVDTEALRKKLKARIQGLDELAQLDDRDQFFKDLADECAWALTTGLDYLTKGTRSKPNEWTTHILARGVATVMRKHRLRVAISEFEDRKHGQLKRSLYLRLVPKVCEVCFPGFPKDVKGLALRAMRIKQESVIIPQIKRKLKTRHPAAPPTRITPAVDTRRPEAVIQAYRELGPELQAYPTDKKTLEHLRIAVAQKLGLGDISAKTIKREIGQVGPILRLVQNGIIPPPGTRRDPQGLSERTRLEMATGKAAVAKAKASLTRDD